MTLIDYTLLDVRPYRLRLERESARHWIVVEASSPDAPMIRTEDRGCAVRFIEAFCARTPGAEVEALHSWRVAQAASRPQNVYPLFHEQLDESA